MREIGKLMGIDHGLKRIGLAVSDALGITVRELTIIERISKKEDFAKINRLAEQEQIIAFIVGMPIHHEPAGTYTQADTVRHWISNFQQTTPLPIIEWDEQLTSDEARELAKQQKRHYLEAIDDLAARVILESYLRAVDDSLTTPPPRPDSH